MQEVLKQIYKQNSVKKQRQMVQKSLKNQQYLHMKPRRKLSFRYQQSVSTPATTITIDNQSRFQKDIYKYISKQPQNNSPRDILLLERSVILPKISKTLKHKGYYIRKFKAAVWSVIFIKRLKFQFENNLVRLKKKAQRSSMKLLQHIDRLVKQYYYDLLNNQLKNYILMIDKYYKDKKPIDDQQIIQLVYNMTNKLSNSTITQHILDFFVLTATNKGFPPSDYLSYIEISRLQVSSKYGYLTNVSNEQTRMMIALGLGIKIFSYYVLYQPFNFSSQNHDQIPVQQQQIQELMHNINSIFYFIIIDQFCLKIKQNKNKNIKILQRFKITMIKPLNPFNLTLKIQKNNQRDLLIYSNRDFYDQMQYKYSDKMRKIKINIQKWINRISYTCIKQTESNKNNKNMSTISKNTVSPFKRAYKSIQVKKQPQKRNINRSRYDIY